MPDEPSMTIRTAYERVVQSTAGLPQYESARATVAIEETFPGTLQPDEVANVVANQFTHAKGAVFTQLGIGFEQDEMGIVREFGSATVVRSEPAVAGRATRALAPAPEPEPYGDEEYAEPEEAPSRPAPSRPAPSAARGRPAPSRAPSRPAPRRAPAAAPADDDGYWEELMNKPDRWYDNRDSKQNDRAPDFRSKDHKEGNFAKGLWLDRAPDWFVDPF